MYYSNQVPYSLVLKPRRRVCLVVVSKSIWRPRFHAAHCMQALTYLYVSGLW